MIAIVQLEKCIARTFIHSVVICKLSHQLEPCPIILFEINKSLNIDFHNAVLSFCLAIYL